MDIIDIKTKLWEFYYGNSEEYLRGYIRCLLDSRFINDGNYYSLCIFITNLYK